MVLRVVVNVGRAMKFLARNGMFQESPIYNSSGDLRHRSTARVDRQGSTHSLRTTGLYEWLCLAYPL